MSPPGRVPTFEMSPIKTREDSVAQGSNYTMREPVYDDEATESIASRVLDSFRRDPGRRVTPLDPKDEAAIRAEAGRLEHDGVRYYDIHQATLQTAHSGLARKLKGRHLQMIAIGGSIGMSPRLPFFLLYMVSRGFLVFLWRHMRRISYSLCDGQTFISLPVKPATAFPRGVCRGSSSSGVHLSDAISPRSKAPDCSLHRASR